MHEAGLEMLVSLGRIQSWQGRKLSKGERFLAEEFHSGIFPLQPRG